MILCILLNQLGIRSRGYDQEWRWGGERGNCEYRREEKREQREDGLLGDEEVIAYDGGVDMVMCMEGFNCQEWSSLGGSGIP